MSTASNFVHHCQCSTSPPAPGKWGHKAAQPCNGPLCKCGQKCTNVQWCTQKGWGGGCAKEARCACGGTQLAMPMAACHTFANASSSPPQSMWILRDRKTLSVCCVEFFEDMLNRFVLAVSVLCHKIAYQVHHFQWCCLPWSPPPSPPPWPPLSPAPPSPSEPARPPHRHEYEVEPSSASSGLAQQGYLHVPGSYK